MVTVTSFSDFRQEDELEALALEGINSGEPIEPGPGYWEDKHRRLDERRRVNSRYVVGPKAEQDIDGQAMWKCGEMW